MKIYVVEYNYFDDHSIEGIFTSEEFAYDYAQMCGDCHYVIECTLDDPLWLEWFEKEKAKREKRRAARNRAKEGL